MVILKTQVQWMANGIMKEWDEQVATAYVYGGTLPYTGNGNWQKQIFDLIANAVDGCVMFHCASGKDRTGVLSALLLGLVGVCENDIISDYIPSYDLIYNSPEYKKERDECISEEIQKTGRPRDEIIDELVKYNTTPPEKIKGVIDYIITNYGTFEKYLIACGISQENLNKIKERFLK